MLKINAEEVTDEALEQVHKIILNPEFTIERFKKISGAAVKMAKWIIAVYQYRRTSFSLDLIGEESVSLKKNLFNSKADLL